MKRDFLQLAHNYDPDKHAIAGWFMSVKLDGVRAFWDGGATRGTLAKDVPFANHDRKGHLVEEPVSTGLWSRYGNVLRAPDWWIDRLPKGVCLDGELYLGNGRFQETTSIVKSYEGDDRWQGIRFMTFDSPPAAAVLEEGEINGVNFKKKITGPMWAKMQPLFKDHKVPFLLGFQDVFPWMQRLEQNDVFLVHEQRQLPYSNGEATEMMLEALNQVTDNGGEGLILRAPNSRWTPKRVATLLKVKKLHDAEATVIGCTAGRLTDKGSKLLGMVGALLCKLDDGTEFELAGLTDAERQLDGEAAVQYAIGHPGQRLPTEFGPRHFPIGSRVTFRYREVTLDGVPKEARYWRQAE